ncbi:MAG: NAD(+)/NADH kinase [Planctomycetia bacterium]|nr:NAD(+)/NADH kinase [Planctomycetia bacterium]
MPDITATTGATPQRRPKVVVLCAGDRPHIHQRAEGFRPAIAAWADIALWDLSFAQPLAGFEADMAIVFGGDGSILRAAHQMGYRQLPVLAVNLGRLGFLADLSGEELLDTLPRVSRGEFRVVEHLMFECRIERAGQVLSQHLGLNEVAVLAGPPFAMLDIHLYVDAELVTTYSCDGLIVSTPVGSTAHSLSAGGPILRKDLQAFVVLALSPHTLTNRPVVDSAERTYELVVPRPHEGTAVVVDGHVVHRIEPGDRVRVERSVARFKLVEVAGQGYYRTLREKLGWGGQLHLGSGSEVISD